MKYARGISLVLAIILLVSLFVGCDGVRVKVNLPFVTDAPETTAEIATTLPIQMTLPPETTAMPVTTFSPVTTVIPETTVEATTSIAETVAPAVAETVGVYISDRFLQMPIDLECRSGSIRLDDGTVKIMDTQYTLDPGEYWIRTPKYLKDLRLSVNGKRLETPCDVQYVGATGMCCYIYTFTGDPLPVSDVTEISCSFSEVKTREERWEENVASFLPPEAKGILAKEKIMFSTESTRMVVYDPIGRGPCVYTTTTNGERFEDAQLEKLLADKEYTVSYYLGGQSGLTDEFALYFMLENNGQYAYVTFYNMHNSSTTDFSCQTMLISEILGYVPDAAFPNTSYPQSADTVEELNVLGDVQSDKRLSFLEALMNEDTETVEKMIGKIDDRYHNGYADANAWMQYISKGRVIIYRDTIYSSHSEKDIYLFMHEAGSFNVFCVSLDAQTGLIDIIRER